MKNVLLGILCMLLALPFTSCAVVGGIFKAGFWTGIIVLVLIVAAIIFVISKMGGKKS